MIKLYIVDNKRKSNIKGFWKSDNGKIFIDNIFIKDIYTLKELEESKQALFNAGELAIFYKEGNHAVIEERSGNINFLHNSRKIRYYSIKASHVKKLLEKFNGLTIIKENKTYLIEVNF